MRRHLSSTVYGKEDIKVIVVLCEKLKENLRRGKNIFQSCTRIMHKASEQTKKKKETKKKKTRQVQSTLYSLLNDRGDTRQYLLALSTLLLNFENYRARRF